MKRRCLLASVGATLSLGRLAGCLDRLGAIGDSTETPSSSPGSSHGSAPSEPAEDIAVMAENEHDEHHEFDLAVSREDGDTVHEGTYLVALGAFREVYNLERADPDGIERFRVAATMDDQTADDVLETSECYGPVLVNIDESGELFVGTVVC